MKLKKVGKKWKVPDIGRTDWPSKKTFVTEWEAKLAAKLLTEGKTEKEYRKVANAVRKRRPKEDVEFLAWVLSIVNDPRNRPRDNLDFVKRLPMLRANLERIATKKERPSSTEPVPVAKMVALKDDQLIEGFIFGSTVLNRQLAVAVPMIIWGDLNLRYRLRKCSHCRHFYIRDHIDFDEPNFCTASCYKCPAGCKERWYESKLKKTSA